MANDRTRPQPAVLLVSDLPAWGRVALASSAPLIEAAGYQACCLPTALLSTHAAYPGYVLEPQTAYLEAAWAHLQTLDLRFAAVAIGFVGDRAQFPLLERIAQSVKASGGLVLVDPILGDNDRLYGVFEQDHVAAFRSLVRWADLITPNVTEAALLLGHDPARTAGQDEARLWTRELAELGPRRVVLTSAPFEGSRTGVTWFDGTDSSEGRVAHRKLGAGIPGSGDALAARLLARLLNGEPFAHAVQRAVKATFRDVIRSQAARRPPLWGAEGPLVP
jgi:pyridoxine kinase